MGRAFIFFFLCCTASYRFTGIPKRCISGFPIWNFWRNRIKRFGFPAFSFGPSIFEGKTGAVFPTRIRGAADLRVKGIRCGGMNRSVSGIGVRWAKGGMSLAENAAGTSAKNNTIRATAIQYLVLTFLFTYLSLPTLASVSRTSIHHLCPQRRWINAQMKTPRFYPRRLVKTTKTICADHYGPSALARTGAA